MGLTCNCFVESIRGLLHVCPNFFEVIDGVSYEKDLDALGFVQIKPDQKDVKLFSLLAKTNEL